MEIPTHSNLASRVDLSSMFMLDLVGHLILISFLMKLSPFKMMSAIKSGVVSHSRFAKMAERDFKVSPLSLSFVSSFFVNPTAKRHFKSKTILLDYHLCCRHSQCLWNSKPTAQKAGMGVIFCPQLKQRQAEYQDKVVSGQTNLPNGIFLVFHQKNLYSWPWKWDRGASIQILVSQGHRGKVLCCISEKISPPTLLNFYYITYLSKKL